MKLELKRSYMPEGTNGDLYINGEFECHTIELPLCPLPAQTCIPEGRYCLKLRCNKRVGKHLIVCGVPKRNNVAIQIAEDALTELTYGRIAPVLWLSTPGAGFCSETALKYLIETLEEEGDQDHELIITSHWLN